jgi:transaldolase|tara:strand:- start:1609 stop:2331 length:723 start_codon:yes stop_codon:yes gene_type:complete
MNSYVIFLFHVISIAVNINQNSMDFFLDTAEVDVIKDLSETGLVDGITTNPSLVAKSGQDFFSVLEKISRIIDGPISAEVTAIDTEGMINEGLKLSKIAKNIVVKLPLTLEGLKACVFLVNKKIRTNVTLCFSANQALLAAKSGATYVSPFIGRLDDIGENGLDLISDIKSIYSNYIALNTKILVASVRSLDHIAKSAIIGADTVTLPPKVFLEMYDHELTKKGLDAFLKDWAETKQSIL